MSLHMLLVIAVPALSIAALCSFPLVLKAAGKVERRGARK
jgi:hypothetical protein